VDQEALVLKGLDGLKTRAKTLIELASGASIYLSEPSYDALDEKALSYYTPQTKELIKEFITLFEKLEAFDHTALEKAVRDFCAEKTLKMGAVAQPLRVALTGATVSPSVFEIMEVLGKEGSLKRLRHYSAS
ncbi:MAG TPA: glutamate--tRNA ligase, partial [Alphaproteobacteria bacterium]|nr:glutamate--tRNA ligase [Alphaproteobacteria bacterium]